MSELNTYTLFLMKYLGDGSVKYMRITSAEDNIIYLEVTMNGKNPEAINKYQIDKAEVDLITSDPAIKGIPPVLFQGRTGIPFH